MGHLIVWVPDREMRGVVEQLGAYASRVRFENNEIEVIPNADFIELDEIGIGYEEE